MLEGNAPSVVTGGYEQVPIDSLEPHPLNVNEGDVGAIHESLASSGFFGAVIAQKSSRRIIVGKHRWVAARQAGMDSIPVLWADVDDDRAVRIMLADNRTARMGHDDDSALAELLSDLMTSDLQLEGTGFTPDDLDDLLNDRSRDYQSVHVVTVECSDEQQQAAVAEELRGQGLTVVVDVKKRALT